MRRLVILSLLVCLTALLAVSPLWAQSGGVSPMCASGCHPYSVSVTPAGTPDTTSLNSSGNVVTFTVINNGTNADEYTLTCPVTGGITCTNLSTTDLPLAAGHSAQVQATFSVGSSFGWIELQATGEGASNTGWYVVTGDNGGSPVSVTPTLARDTVLANGTLDSVQFQVTNTGTLHTGHYALTYSCTTITCPSSNNPNPAGPLTLNPQASASVWVKYYHASSLSTGQISLTAADTLNDIATGNHYVTSVVPATPSVALHNLNNANQDRGLCLTLGAGQASGLSCGDLFVTHAMPTYRTMSRNRQLTLFYNSAAAAPRPTVAVWVSNASGTQPPSAVRARLTINGVVRDSATYNSWSAGATRQIVLAWVTDTTSGLYPFTLTVRNIYPFGSYETSVSDTLIVVNRAHSEFGAGWWVDGVEQIISQPGNRMLWLGGDASAAVYEPAGTNAWVRAAGPFRDTLVYNSSTHVYTRTLRHGIQVKFDTTGRHIQTINRAGNTSTFTWSGNPRRLTSIQVPPGVSGTTYTLSYDGSSNLDYINDPASRRLDATVGSGNLAQLLDPDNVAVSFGYDAAHRLTGRTSRRGYATQYYYTNGLHVDSVHVPLKPGAGAPYDTARTRLAWWDERGLAVGNPGGTQTAADTASVYTRFDGPRASIGDSARFWVDRWGAPVQVVGAVNDTTLIARNTSSGLVTRMRGPVGQTWGIAYDARGNVLTINDSTHEGHGTGGFQTATTRYTYHSAQTADSPDSVIDPEQLTTRYVYNAIGEDSLVTAPNGQQTRFLYATGSTAGLVLSVTDLAVRTYEDTTISGWGTSTSYSDLPTSLAYNTLGNLISVTTPKGSVTRYGYNTYTQGIADTNAVGRVTRYYPRPMGVVDSMVQLGDGSDRRLTQFTYDADFNRLTLADPRNMTRGWGYDAAGRDTSMTDDYGQIERHYYGPSGLLDSTRTRVGLIIKRAYDAAGRLTWMAFPATDATYAPADSISYAYDAAGRLTQATNRTGTVARQYYREGTLKQDSTATIGGWNPQTVHQYRYFRDDLRSLYTDMAGGGNTIQLAYTYNAGYLYRLVITWPGGNPGPDTATYTWDGLGRRQQVVLPLHRVPATVNWYYDRDGRLRRIYTTAHTCQYNCINDSAQVDVRYRAYDSVGRVVSITQQVGQNTAIDSAAFDPYGEESYHISMGGRRDFTYDASGSMLSSLQWLNPDRYGRTFVMQAGHNRLYSDSVVDQRGPAYHAKYRYDLNGNRIEDSTISGDPLGYRRSYYDALNRLTSLGSITVTYSCVQDASTATGTVMNNTGTCQYLGNYTLWADAYKYDALGRRLKAPNSYSTGYWSAYNADDEVTWVAGTRIVYGVGRNDPLVVYDTLQPGDPGHRMHYFITDGAGLLLSYVDSAGYDQRVGANHVYEDRAVYASVTANGHSFGATSAQSGATPDLGFFQNRYYDQRTGRWTQEDPIGPAGGVNLYAYVGNNPITYSDPFGLEPLTDKERKALGNTCKTIDCDQIRVHRGNDGAVTNGVRAVVLKASLGAAITLGNDIFLPSSVAHDIPTLAHEVTHAGEYQLDVALGAATGGAAGVVGGIATYYAQGGWDQSTRLFGHNPYALPAVLPAGVPWGSYGFEQRAQIVEDCFLAVAGRCTVSPYHP